MNKELKAKIESIVKQLRNLRSDLQGLQDDE